MWIKSNLSFNKRYILSIFTIFAVLFFISCEDKLKNIKAGMVTWPGYEPIVLAKDLGFLGKNITISRTMSSNDVLNAFKHDLIDVAFLTLDETITLFHQIDEEIKIVVVTDISNGADALIGQKAIGSVSDLKGKKLAFESTSVGKYMFTRAIEEHKSIEMKDISIVSLPLDRQSEAFKKNIVDAVITFEPIKSKLLGLGGHILFDSSMIPNEIVDVIVVKSKTIKTHKKEIKQFIRGWFKSIEYINKNNEKAMKKMAGYENITLNDYKNGQVGLKIPSLDENNNLLCGNKPLLFDSVNYVENFLVKNFMVKESNKELKGLFTNEFCE